LKVNICVIGELDPARIDDDQMSASQGDCLMRAPTIGWFSVVLLPRARIVRAR
jgi:hypothetical protein